MPKLYYKPAKIERKALFDDMLTKNMKFHTSLADQKRIWMGGEDDPQRFRKEDLAAWFRVWD